MGCIVTVLAGSYVAGEMIAQLIYSILGYYVVSVILSYILKNKSTKDILVVALLVRLAISLLLTGLTVDSMIIDLVAFTYWFFYDQVTGLHLLFKDIKLF